MSSQQDIKELKKYCKELEHESNVWKNEQCQNQKKYNIVIN